MDANDNEPVRKKCRVKPISGIKGFAVCLEPDAQVCPHSLSFGYTMLCYHPEWQQMMIIDEGE